MQLLWHKKAWEEYLEISQTNKALLKKTNSLISSIMRNSDECIGKHEMLKGNLKGYRSARIDKQHRLVYKVNRDSIEILQCWGHY